MLQLFGQHHLLVQQPFLRFGQDLHLLDGGLQECRAHGGGDGFGQDIGEAGEEIDVVLVIIVLLVIVDLQYALWPFLAFDDDDDDVGGRDDAVLGVEGRRFKVIVLAQIVANRWLPW